MPFESLSSPHLVSDLLLRAAELQADAIALVDRWGDIDFGTLADRARLFAAALTKRGIAPGDRVALVVDKRIEIVAAMHGIYLAGAVLVPVNPQLKPRQIAHILSDSGARLLIVAADRAAVFDNLHDTDSGLATLSRDGAIDGGLAGPASDTPEEFQNRGLATLFYTSGSTGLPKAVACTHANILAGAESVAGYIGNTADDVILGILPLSFDAGFSQLTTALQVGARVVLQDYLLPADIARACERNGVTGITGVPAIWAAALKARWDEAAASRIRYFANTGGHLAYERQRQLRALFPNARAFPMYGLTEAFRSTYLDPSMTDLKPGSIGKAIPGATVLVVNEAGEETAPDEAGELVHAGPTVALGYWKNPDETARRYKPAPQAMLARGISGNVVYSGDLVVRDADGYLFYKGRRDGLVKISGNRISYAEIEAAAIGFPDVAACASGALPPPEAGADPVLVLFAELRSGSHDTSALEAHLKRELPGYAVPSRIIVMDHLPLNQNGKYDVKLLLSELA